MQIGLFFGSFNPIHTGHLLIANHILNFTPLHKIWFIVSPQNPLKEDVELLNEEQRLKLVRLATNGDKRFEVSDIEFQLPKPSYTINTFSYLRKAYPENSFRLIIGSDNFLNFSAWKSHDELLREGKIVVYIRPGYPVDTFTAQVEVLTPAQLDISSTEIRRLIKDGKSVRYLVPEAVFLEIATNNYYR